MEREDLAALLSRGAIKRVLVVRLARLGDILFTTPALRALAKALPGARIDYLTTGYCRDLLAGNPHVSRVLHLDRRWHLPGYFKRRRALALELEAGAYDLAVVFEAKYSTRLMLARMLAAAGVKHLISRDTEHPDLRHEDAPAEARVHACDRHAALLAGLGVSADSGSYELHVAPHDIDAARALLAEHGIVRDGRRRLVGAQMGCHYSMWPSWFFLGQRYKYHKTWPEAAWVALGCRLLDDPDLDLVLTGAGVEQPIADRVADAIAATGRRRPINLAGATSVGTLAGLLASVDLFVSVDTGSMHMATALGVPTIALFGPTDPTRHGPYRPRADSQVLVSGVACSPCKKGVRKACRVNQCMRELDPGRVAAAASAMLARAGKTPAAAASVHLGLVAKST